MSVEAHVLGRARPCVPSWPRSGGDAELQVPRAATAAEIKEDILEHGVSERGVMRQHYATDSLDASVLLAAIFGFLPHDDERFRSTVLAIAEELAAGERFSHTDRGDG